MNMRSFLTFCGIVAIAVVSVLVIIAGGRELERSNNANPKQPVVYTVRQYSVDGKLLAEWSTHSRPVVTENCVRWREPQEMPEHTVCGGILQVTPQLLLTHQITGSTP